jgi:hypothetical protein
MKELLEKIAGIEDPTRCSNLILDYVENQLILLLGKTRPEEKVQIEENLNIFFDELISLNLDIQNYYNIVCWFGFTNQRQTFNNALKKFKTLLKLDT